MKVDTVREPRDTSQRAKETSDEEPEHLPRTNDHEVAKAELWRWRCKRRTSEQ